MRTPAPAERRVVGLAALAGLAVAAAASFVVGRNAGVELGLAVFALSWTFVALFALVVRTLYLRFFVPAASRRRAPLPPPSPPSPARSSRGRGGGRRRRRRR